MKYSHIIWDFNGTILDDVSIGIKAINILLSKRGLKTIDNVEEYRRIFGFPIKDYYRRCGFDFSVDNYEDVLAPEWVREYERLEKNARMCYGVLHALKLFSESAIKQSILSASLIDMLTSQIERLEINNYFYKIVGCDNFFAYGKTQLCVDFVRENHSDSLLLVGDSTHDYEVAKAAGIDCVLICQGHMSRQTLEQCGCPVFDNALEFSEYILNY